MGHTKRKRPQRGSRAVWPRKRAKRINAMVKNFAPIKDTKLLGFAGYKAWMTSVIIVDNRPKTPTKGEELKRAVTIIEAPSLKVGAIRVYAKTSYGKKVLSEVWAEGLSKDKDLSRTLILPKKRKATIESLKQRLSDISEVRLESHKAEFGRRHRSTMGPTTPSKVGWWIPMPGQMGFHKRTHYNSQILKIANINDLQINPISGLSRYGKVKGDFILIAGSAPGAKKRLVVLSHAIRPASKLTEAPEIVDVSLRSQQQ